jgi:hypothetical protein
MGTQLGLRSAVKAVGVEMEDYALIYNTFYPRHRWPSAPGISFSSLRSPLMPRESARARQ